MCVEHEVGGIVHCPVLCDPRPFLAVCQHVVSLQDNSGGGGLKYGNCINYWAYTTDVTFSLCRIHTWWTEPTK